MSSAPRMEGDREGLRALETLRDGRLIRSVRRPLRLPRGLDWEMRTTPFQEGSLVPLIGLDGEGVFAGGEVAKSRVSGILAFSGEPRGCGRRNGIFFIPWAREGKSNKTTEDPPRP